MRKFISLLAISMMAVAVYSQEPATGSNNTPVQNKTTAGFHLDKNLILTISEMAPEGCVYFTNGKVYMVKDGKASDLKTDVMFSNGAKVTSNGMMTFKGGSTTTLQDGQCVKMNGSFFVPVSAQPE